MRTSWRILQDARRAIAAAIVFSGFMAVLALAIPLFILHVLQSAASAGNLDKLLALGAISAAAVVAALALEAARNSLLLRAGLWLDHELASVLLSTSRSDQSSLLDRARLRQVTESLTRGDAAVWIDAQWAPVTALALALIHPLFGVLALGVIAANLLLSLASFRKMANTADNELRSEAGAAEAWVLAERQTWQWHNTRSIASAYSLERQSGFARCTSRGLSCLALILLAVIAADLFAKDVLASPSIAAALLLMTRLSFVLERTSETIPAFLRTWSAWRSLRQSISMPVVECAEPAGTADQDCDVADFMPAYVHTAVPDAGMNRHAA